MSTSLDPRAVKDAQRATWDALSTGWAEAWEVFERGASAVTGRLLDLGGVRPGQAVLDVGTGLGEPALSAARRVGRTGRVVATDISPEMLRIARRRAAALGDAAANVEFAEADVEAQGLPPGSFDVVLSRWGLMFAVDHVAAFGGLRRLLGPGGVLATAVWGPQADAPVMTLGFTALSALLDLPPVPPDAPGPFSMADPAALTAELRAAGFSGVSVEEMRVPFAFASATEYVAFTRAVTPRLLLDRIRDRYGSPDAREAWRVVEAATDRFRTGSGGVYIPSKVLCARASNPGDGL
ncbi:class I SAM-dependent methyltransferase [Actinomadura harenae]|uniref:Class I SAM-dependent methyltransferase n=1 Tax=Actinomadura harenae TaxID=2483351 RepID=A0A3M2LHZ9_9ACTN|nr:class I SAM-dependent methyltransferase [Actinomadura harenae]RMI36173.1 class I SAM-dependent methyltransferase [Actinomadura harenae]